jgi:hypothetical protein
LTKSAVLLKTRRLQTSWCTFDLRSRHLLKRFSLMQYVIIVANLIINSLNFTFWQSFKRHFIRNLPCQNRTCHFVLGTNGWVESINHSIKLTVFLLGC